MSGGTPGGGGAKYGWDGGGASTIQTDSSNPPDSKGAYWTNRVVVPIDRARLGVGGGGGFGGLGWYPIPGWSGGGWGGGGGSHANWQLQRPGEISDEEAEAAPGADAGGRAATAHGRKLTSSDRRREAELIRMYRRISDWTRYNQRTRGPCM